MIQYKNIIYYIINVLSYMILALYILCIEVRNVKMLEYGLFTLEHGLRLLIFLVGLDFEFSIISTEPRI